jgi:hypothetical protein
MTAVLCLALDDFLGVVWVGWFLVLTFLVLEFVWFFTRRKKEKRGEEGSMFVVMRKIRNNKRWE